MKSLAPYLDAVTNASSIEALWNLHTAQMAGFGFDRLIYGFTRYRSGTSLGDPQDWIVLTNHSPAYMRPFIDDGLYFHAPMVRWALENDGACSWRWMEDMARRDAAEWIARSPTLSWPEEALIKRRLLKAFGEALGLADVG